MSIEVVCECGKRFQARDEYAGRTGMCPACKRLFLVEVPVDLEPVNRGIAIAPGVEKDWHDANTPPPLPPPNPDEPEPFETKPKLPIWRDPIVVIGAAVPTMILIVFFGYLYQGYAARQFRLRVYHMKVEADALAKSQKSPGAAFDKYEDVLAIIRDRNTSDPMVAGYADATRLERDRLYPAVKAELVLEESRRAAQLEAQKLIREVKAEHDRLSGFVGNIGGGAWVVNKIGQSNVLRGLHVRLLPARLRKGDVDDILAKAKDRAAFGRGAYGTLIKNSRNGTTVVEGLGVSEATKLAENYESAERSIEKIRLWPDDSPIDAELIYIACRTTAHATKGMSRILDEDLWPSAASRIKVAEATTNIDGKYELKNVTGGRYFIYALHATEYALIEWMLPILVDKSADLSLDLHNEKATYIINKSD